MSEWSNGGCDYHIISQQWPDPESCACLSLQQKQNHGDLAEEINGARKNWKFGWQKAEMLAVRLHKDVAPSRHLCYFDWLNPAKACYHLGEGGLVAAKG